MKFTKCRTDELIKTWPNKLEVKGANRSISPDKIFDRSFPVGYLLLDSLLQTVIHETVELL